MIEVSDMGTYAESSEDFWYDASAARRSMNGTNNSKARLHISDVGFTACGSDKIILQRRAIELLKTALTARNRHARQTALDWLVRTWREAVGFAARQGAFTVLCEISAWRLDRGSVLCEVDERWRAANARDYA